MTNKCLVYTTFYLFVVLASERSGDYKMSTFMGFGTGGLGPMDSVKVISDSVQTANAGVFVGFLLTLLR